VRRAERACAWAVLAFCAAYAFAATRIEIRLGQQVGAAAFPLAAAGFTALSSALFLLTSRRTSRPDPADIGRTEIYFAGLGFAYWLLLPWLGYMVATPLLLLAGAACLGERLALRPVVVSIGMAAAMWAIFAFLLDVPLPETPLGFD
jgi:hypothetical protein